jgi:hypothetical protein
MEEQWKVVEELQGKYKISNKGNFISFKPKNRVKHPYGYLIKLNQDIHGYIYVVTRMNGKHILFKVHRLVAKYFIPNPKNKPCVNHIDGVKNNNNVNNLEWVTYSENSIHAYRTGLKIGKSYMKGLFGKDNPTSIKVRQLTLDGKLIKIHNGISEASRIINGCPSHIVKVCKGKLNKHKGFKWEYI